MAVKLEKTKLAVDLRGWRGSLIVGLVAGVLLPAVAVARRVASGNEKTAIVHAARRAHDIPAADKTSCLKVFVSTANRTWANLTDRSTAKRCQPETPTPVLTVVLHRRDGRWHVVLAGNLIICPLPKSIPRGVKRDLKISCSTGVEN